MLGNVTHWGDHKATICDSWKFSLKFRTDRPCWNVGFEIVQIEQRSEALGSEIGLGMIPVSNFNTLTGRRPYFNR